MFGVFIGKCFVWNRVFRNVGI